jgi:hypothetical protein
VTHEVLEPSESLDRGQVIQLESTIFGYGTRGFVVDPHLWQYCIDDGILMIVLYARVSEVDGVPQARMDM